jgi:hypothetical protein
MRFVMMDTEQRAIQNKREGLSHGKSDPQGCRQTGTASGCDNVQLICDDACLLQGQSRDRNQIPQVFSGGEFGNHPSVLRMKLYLRGDDIRQH